MVTCLTPQNSIRLASLCRSLCLSEFYLNSLSCYIFFKIYVDLFIYVLYALHAFGGQRTTYESKSSPSTMLVPRIKLRSPGLATCAFAPQTTSPILFMLHLHACWSSAVLSVLLILSSVSHFRIILHLFSYHSFIYSHIHSYIPMLPRSSLNILFKLRRTLNS